MLATPSPNRRPLRIQLRAYTVLALTVIHAVACYGRIQDEPGDGETETPPVLKGSASALGPAPALGDPLPGLTPAQLSRFAAGRDDFEEEEDVADGLGPVFNGTSCGGCHSAPAVGGGSTITETRFGRVTAGVFDPLTNLGGSLLQSQGIGTVTANGQTCTFNGEVVPPSTIVAGRLTTPLFGLGLVDAVPDSTFLALADRQSRDTPGTAGRASVVTNVVTGQPAVGKFGWKAQVPTLFQFSGDAYLNEMGITSPFFRDENCPQGNCALLACDPVPDVEDDGEDVQAFADFMTFLAPPRAATASAAGEQAFQRLGCTSCHTPQLTTGPNSVAALDRKKLFPYSDFLLHDMGSLGDGIVQGSASATQMRTAPLWGARARSRFLHDGRATTINDAILAHEGQGAAARTAFQALPQAQRTQLLEFVGGL
jgi:CxxC motif-containing protein (DUF1111 family)